MKVKQLNIRITENEHRLLKVKVQNAGFKNVASYVRFCMLNAEIKVKVKSDS